MFYLMIPSPLCSTLFPYTTLFRSSGKESLRRRRGVQAGAGALGADGLACREAAARSGIVPERAAADRKSTRLNSSHTVISYAVFCLKKKKNKRRPSINQVTIRT